MLQGKKRIAVMVMAILLFCCSCGTDTLSVPQVKLSGTVLPEAAKNQIKEEIIDSHSLIAENDKFSLFLNKDALSVIIRDNDSGTVMNSAVQVPDENDTPMWKNFTMSGISIEYFSGTATTAARADMFLKKPTKTVTRTDDGFYANIDYSTLGISFTVVVSLTEQGISVSVPGELIKENGDSKLSAIYVFPFLGYSKLGDKDGYMFIPDGCGALISLENNEGEFTQPYSAKVYGDDFGIDKAYESTQLFDDSVSMYVSENTVTAPVFGMVHTDDKIGYLGVVKSGACYSEIYAYPNGAITQYNWITSKFIYRKTYYLPTSKQHVIPAVQENMNYFDAKTDFLFVTGEEADYNGLAKSYRRFLKENDMLSQRDNKTSVRLELFGGDLEKGLLSNEMSAVTTTVQAQEILTLLKDKGIENILAVFTAFSDNGRFGSINTNGFEVSKDLGGKKGFSVLADYCKENGITLLADVDVTLSNKASSFSNDLVAKSISNKVIQFNTGKKIFSTSYLYNPLTTASSITNQADRCKAFKISGLSVDGLTKLYSDYNAKASVSRLQSQMIYSSSCENVGKSMELALSTPFDFLWKYTDSYFDFPVYSSNYKFVVKEIPFFAIALQGEMNLYSEYVNFNADSEEFHLKLIECGLLPSFLLSYESSNKLMNTDSNNLYSTDYKSYIERIEKYYSDITYIKELTDGSNIDRHLTENGLAIVEYSNGTKVYVNYNDYEISIDSEISVKANNYCVVKP